MKLSLEIEPRSVLRWLIALLLIWAALGKLANPQEFYASLLAYRLPLPSILLRAVAIILPWLELLCGLLIVGKVRRSAALSWALFLFAIFTVATAQAWMRGLQISCGCFDLRMIGLSPEGELGALLQSVGFAFVRALGLAAAAFYLLQAELKTAPEARG